jgi:serine/threonine protein kinase
VTEGQRYDLLEPIAAGGMGEVFVGRVRGEHGFQKPVAIKRILPELARNPEFVVRFVAEAKLAVSLSHANVVQVFDLGRAGEDLLLVMEYVQGTDLGQLLARIAERRERVPVPIAVYVATEALKGLVYAHEHRERDGRSGVIHCDLSPSNLLVSWAGEVKIGDFGVAQAVDVARKKRDGGGVMGKVRYMAPEQLLGEPLDPRTDLYSLAVVIHEALTLRRPFDAGDLDGTAAAVVAGAQLPVSSYRDDVPEALDKLLARTMSRDSSRRPASAREMLAELTRIAQKLDPVTPPDVGGWARSALEQPVDSPRRRTASMPAAKATATFLVKQNVDGITVLEKEPPRPRSRRTIVAGLALGCGLFAVGLVALRPKPPEPGPPPIAHAPAPPIAPEPAPPTPSLPAVVVTPAEEPRPHKHAPLAPGFVNIYAEPWANVAVDGKPAGSTPLARLALPPGVHRVRLTHPKSRPIERTVRIESGKVELLDVDLELSPEGAPR